MLSFPAPFIGGLMFELGGLRLPILANLAGIVVVIVGLIVLIREPR